METIVTTNNYTYAVINTEEIWDGLKYVPAGCEYEAVAEFTWGNKQRYILFDAYTGRSFTYEKDSFKVKE